jgi:hypothetical protein
VIQPCGNKEERDGTGRNDALTGSELSALTAGLAQLLLMVGGLLLMFRLTRAWAGRMFLLAGLSLFVSVYGPNWLPL